MFSTLICVFMIPLELQGHTIPHFKVLRYGKYESRGLCCGSTSSICHDYMKSDNFQHKRGFVDSQMKTIVCHRFNKNMLNAYPHDWCTGEKLLNAITKQMPQRPI